VTQTYNNCAETHNWWWSYEPFCLPVIHHHLSARSNCQRQCSSQEMPTKILSTL